MELAREVQRAGATFAVRRALQRLVNAEISPSEAARLIRGGMMPFGSASTLDHIHKFELKR